MKLSDLIQELALGELQSTPLVDVGEFQINPKFLPKTLNAINGALNHFYSVFPLKTANITLQVIEGISEYYLHSEYAESNKLSSSVKYIKDNELNPFQDDILQITSVSTLNGETLPIDDIFASNGIILVQPNCIKVSSSLNEKYLDILYQASHRQIPLTEPANSGFQVNIPLAMKNAFMAYVSCLVLQNMGGSKLEESNAFFAKYQTQMEILKSEGIGVKSITGINIKPYLRGWI